MEYYVPLFAASLVLVFAGVYSLLASRNLLRILVSIEVAFNGVILLVLMMALASSGSPVQAAALVLFAIALTAVEVAVLTAIILLTYRVKGSIVVDKVRELKG